MHFLETVRKHKKQFLRDSCGRDNSHIFKNVINIIFHANFKKHGVVSIFMCVFENDVNIVALEIQK